MDNQTLTHYNQHAADMSAQYESADVTRLHQRLLEALPSGGRVLEVECGSGRDLAFLQAQGFDVTGLEPSEGMRAGALAGHPGLTGRLHPGTIPFPTGMGGLKPPYDAVLAIAVIMHLTDPELTAWIRQLKSVIRPGGVLFLSASYDREGMDGQRDAGGRLFVERTPAQVESMMREGGLEKVRMFRSRDTLKRTLRWFTPIYRMSPEPDVSRRSLAKAEP
jgi:SAM-dependent methyltransferase